MPRSRREIVLHDLSQAPGAIAATKLGSKKPTIFLADDQERVLRAVILALRDECQIVGLAVNGRDVLELVPALHPEVLVLDIFMPLVNGIEAAFRLKTVGCCCKVIFLTMQDDTDFVEAALATGAQGYVLKSRLATDLVPAIKSALENACFISPGVQLVSPNVISHASK